MARRPVSRQQMTAAAIDSTDVAVKWLQTVDLRKMPVPLRNQFKEARRLTAAAREAQLQALKMDVPTNPLKRSA